jgi:hypothetical protein
MTALFLQLISLSVRLAQCLLKFCTVLCNQRVCCISESIWYLGYVLTTVTLPSISLVLLLLLPSYGCLLADVYAVQAAPASAGVHVS